MNWLLFNQTYLGKEYLDNHLIELQLNGGTPENFESSTSLLEATEIAKRNKGDIIIITTDEGYIVEVVNNEKSAIVIDDSEYKKHFPVTEEIDQFIKENGGNARDALNVALARLEILKRKLKTI